MNPKVDEYLSSAKKWPEELIALRKILLETDLTEDYKWRGPCYTFDNSNLVMIGELNDCCVLSFFKGALLKDPKGLLEQPGKNSRSARYMRFTDVESILKSEAVIKSYVKEAIEAEKAGLEIDWEKDADVPVPEEIQAVFDREPKLEEAFAALTPGRRRGYLLHFSAAKQSKTKVARLEKYREKILAGKGMNDWK